MRLTYYTTYYTPVVVIELGVTGTAPHMVIIGKKKYNNNKYHISLAPPSFAGRTLIKRETSAHQVIKTRVLGYDALRSVIVVICRTVYRHGLVNCIIAFY